MTGIWSAIILILQVMNANREPWVKPLPGVRMEPIRPVRHEEDFAPDSAYRLLVRAGELPVEDDALLTARDWLGTLADHAFPKRGVRPGGDAPSWPDHERAAVQELLLAVAPNLALGRRAAAAADPQVPARDWSGMPPPYLMNTRPVVRLLALSAYWREAEGDPSGALDELLTCIRLGNILARGSSLLGHLVDIRISRLATDPIWRIATRNELPAPVLRRAAKQLLDLADQVEPYAEVIRRAAPDFVSLGDEVHSVVGQMLRDDVPDQPVLRWVLVEGSCWLTGSSRAMVKSDLRIYCQHLVQWADQPYCAAVAERASWYRTWLADGGLRKTILSVRNPVGRCVAATVTPLVAHGIEDAADRDAVLRGTALYLAIRAYEAEHGKPPAKLADLVPEYLPRVPLDPFDGKPFRYRVAGQGGAAGIPESWGDVSWGIYSIGRDFGDDHGCLIAPLNLKNGRSGRGAPKTDMVWIPKLIPRPKADDIDVFGP